MNDELKQLAEQAGFILWADEDWNPGDVIDWASNYDEELVRFAQLVAEKCAKICTSDDIEKPTGVYYARQIEKHFEINNE